MYNNSQPPMPGYGPTPFGPDAQAFEIKGKWTNRVTGQTVIVRDSVITDDSMGVILSDGSMIDMNDFSRDYIQMSDDIYDMNGHVIGHDPKPEHHGHHHGDHPEHPHFPGHEFDPPHGFDPDLDPDFSYPDVPHMPHGPKPGKHPINNTCPPKPLPEGVRPIHKPGPKPPMNHHKPTVRPPKPVMPPRPIPSVKPSKPCDGHHNPGPDFKAIKHVFDKIKPTMSIDTIITSEDFPIEELKLLNRIFDIPVSAMAVYLYENLLGRKEVLKALETWINNTLFPQEEIPEEELPNDEKPEEKPKCPCCSDGSIEISGPNGWTGEGPCPCQKPNTKPDDKPNDGDEEEVPGDNKIIVTDIYGNEHDGWIGDDNLFHFQDGDKEVFVMDDDGKEVFGWYDETDRTHIKYLGIDGQVVHEILNDDPNLPNIEVITSWDGNEYETTPDGEGNLIYFDDEARQCMTRIEDGARVYFYWKPDGSVAQVYYDDTTGEWEEYVLPMA